MPPPSLQIRFWGTRGSVPSPGPTTVQYGGNTPCVEVRSAAGDLAILDAGTGIRALGRELLATAGATPLGGDIYITHAHWDHIQGLPFFAPLFDTGHRFRIWAAPELAGRIERAVRAQMAPDVFPVPFEQVRAELEFRAVGGATPPANGFRVTAVPARHPGGAIGYRVAACNGSGAALVYLPDNELDPQAVYDAPADWRERLLDVIRGAAVLVHDAMYTAPESEAHRGWGHSSVDAALDLAADAGVPRLVLFHHRPERTDAEIDALTASARARAEQRGATLDVVAAAEGLTLWL